MEFGSPAETIKTDVLIIGGGISGLSAARYLKKSGTDFLLIELDKKTGGNSVGGRNDVSSFPWGAHYLPLPGDGDLELLDFLREIDVIADTKHGLPVYNDYYLCHDPKERLYINNYWQDGIIPSEGVPSIDRDQISRFLAMMHDFKEMKGSDGLAAFAIPVSSSSQDKSLISLDKISAEDFLRENKFWSPYLLWYVNYCCADDYGAGIGQTSAWAMIHYFASRSGKAANAASDNVLTWPEGNYWLVKQMETQVRDHVRTRMLAYDVTLTSQGCESLVYDAERNLTMRVVSQHVIVATPQFINQRLLKKTSREVDYKAFRYSPWMVANLTVDSPLNERRGESLCWDNVIYGSDALGYVNASHQQVNVHHNERVITYYKPLVGADLPAMRQRAHSQSYDQWQAEIFDDLTKPHPSIRDHVRELNVWVWGHGMVTPSPGFLWSDTRMNASSSLGQRIHFAHSDLAGISIFEEGFYYGHQAAKRVLSS